MRSKETVKKTRIEPQPIKPFDQVLEYAPLFLYIGKYLKSVDVLWLLTTCVSKQLSDRLSPHIWNEKLNDWGIPLPIARKVPAAKNLYIRLNKLFISNRDEFRQLQEKYLNRNQYFEFLYEEKVPEGFNKQNAGLYLYRARQCHNQPLVQSLLPLVSDEYPNIKHWVNADLVPKCGLEKSASLNLDEILEFLKTTLDRKEEINSTIVPPKISDLIKKLGYETWSSNWIKIDVDFINNINNYTLIKFIANEKIFSFLLEKAAEVQHIQLFQFIRENYPCTLSIQTPFFAIKNNALFELIENKFDYVGNDIFLCSDSRFAFDTMAQIRARICFINIIVFAKREQVYQVFWHHRAENVFQIERKIIANDSAIEILLDEMWPAPSHEDKLPKLRALIIKENLFPEYKPDQKLQLDHEVLMGRAYYDGNESWALRFRGNSIIPLEWSIHPTMAYFTPLEIISEYMEKIDINFLVDFAKDMLRYCLRRLISNCSIGEMPAFKLLVENIASKLNQNRDKLIIEIYELLFYSIPQHEFFWLLTNSPLSDWIKNYKDLNLNTIIASYGQNIQTSLYVKSFATKFFELCPAHWVSDRFIHYLIVCKDLKFLNWFLEKNKNSPDVLNKVWNAVDKDHHIEAAQLIAGFLKRKKEKNGISIDELDSTPSVSAADSPNKSLINSSSFFAKQSQETTHKETFVDEENDNDDMKSRSKNSTASTSSTVKEVSVEDETPISLSML